MQGSGGSHRAHGSAVRRAAFAAALMLTLAYPAASRAGTAWVEPLPYEGGPAHPSALHFSAPGPEDNTIVARGDIGLFQFVDLTADIETGAHCTRLAPHAAECVPRPLPVGTSPLQYVMFTRGEIDLGPGNDTFDDPLATNRECLPIICSPIDLGGEGIPLVIRGGDGDDRIGVQHTPHSGPVEVHGGAGNDIIDTSEAGWYPRTVVRCGPGFDIVSVRRGDDVSRDCEFGVAQQ